MKLNDLEELVRRMRATSGVDANPEVLFWVRDNRKLEQAAAKCRTTFVDLDIDNTLLGQPLGVYQVVTQHPQSTQALGDFSLPMDVLE